MLAPGGVCFVAVQEGIGEGSERRRRYGVVERLFSRYTLDEMGDLLRASGFRLQEHSAETSGPPTWLQYLAVAE